MSVLSRLAVGLLLAGLAIGVGLRATVGRRRFRALLALTLIVPAVLHAGAVTVGALLQHASPWGAVAFLAGGAVVVATGTWAGRRWIAGRGLWAALTPLLTGVVYTALPFGLYSLALRRQGTDLDVVPTALYLGACLFGAALLLPFAPSGGGPARGLGRWLRRR